MKHLLFAILGALAILAVGITYSPANGTVFSTPGIPGEHHYTATDNGDACFTPEETAGLRQGGKILYEKIAFYDKPEDVLKLKEGVIKLFPDTKMGDMTWVAIDVYKFTTTDGVDMVITSLYSRDAAGNLCAFAGGPGPITDWNKIVEAAGMAPKASQIHLGFIGRLHQ